MAGLVEVLRGDRPGPLAARPAAARPLRQRPARRPRAGHRPGHRQRRLQGDRRRADRSLRHDRDRLRRHERQRPDLRRRRAAGACSITSPSSGPIRACCARSRSACGPAPRRPGSRFPGGEVCQVPEVLRGHPSPHGFDLVGSAFGTVALRPDRRRRRLPPRRRADRPALLGRALQWPDAGPPRAARGRRTGLDARPDELGGDSVADVLLEPTVIYVRAVLDLLRSGIDVHGLAHITGGGSPTCCGSAGRRLRDQPTRCPCRRCSR